MIAYWRKIKDSLNSFGERISEKELIVFDYRVLLVLIMGILLFFGLTLFKINGSSVGIWDSYVKQGSEDKNVLLGTPKAIRSDEWLVLTPFAISQSKKGFPVKNTNIGANKDPLLLNLPAKHSSMFFRPQFWGYFLFDVERGFSFFWAFKAVSLFLSSFLLLLFLTKNNFYLSLLGSVWVYFSSFVQWWFSIPLPEMVASINVIVLSLSYLLFSRKKNMVFAGAIFFVVSSINFILFLYPPFQISLVYLALAIISGLLLTKEYWELLKAQLVERLGLLLACGIFVGSLLLFYYLGAKETIGAITSTVYPGKRISLGGEIEIAKLFSGFTGYPRAWGKLPAMFSNSSEASNFLLFFPLIFIMLFRDFVIGIKINKIILTISAYLAVFCSWTLIKFPTVLGKISLLSYIPSKRALLGIGLASTILVILYMSEKGKAPDKKLAAFLAFLVFSIFTIFAFVIKSADAASFGSKYLILTSLLFTLMAYFIIMKKTIGLWLAVVLLVVIPNALVNPVSAGLDSITGKDVSRIGNELSGKKGKWVVYGDHVYANFYKASGLDVFNGTKFTPDLETLKILDPSGGSKDIYNRYAHMSVWEADGAEEVGFLLLHPDAYALKIDPCSKKLKEIGVTNAVFTYKPSAEKVSCLELEESSDADNTFFYKIK